MQNEALRPAYPIESVANALKLILLFRERPQIGVAEAAAVLGVARSTAHRLLAMLQYAGFAEQEAGSRLYKPGRALHEVGLAAIRSMDLRGLARPTMERVARETGETVLLAVRDGTRMLFLDTVESANPLRLTTRTGMYYPAHISAIGRVHLAALDDAEVARLYPSEQLEPGTTLPLPRAIATRADLLRDLAETRRRGYAANIGDPEKGVSAVAALVRDGTGRPRASLAVGGPTSRLDAQTVHAVARAVIAGADEIGRLLA